MSESHLPKSMIRQLDRLERAAQWAIEKARSLGAEDCQAYAAQGERASIRIRDAKVELLSEARSTSLRLRVLKDHRSASSSTNDLRKDAIQSFVRTTVEMAELSEPDALSEAPKPAPRRGRLKDLEEFDAAAPKISVARCLRLAKAAEKAAMKHSKKISASEGASCARSVAGGVLVTGAGFLERGAGTSVVLSASVVADDEEGKKRRGSHYSAVRFVEDLEEAKFIGNKAASRALDQIGAVKMKTGRYPVVFEREVAGDILGLFARCVLGGALYRDRSYLKSKLGKKVAAKGVTILDDPGIVRGFGSRHFDAEGQRCKKRTIVDNGELQSFLLDTYSARKLKMQSTGSAAGAGSTPYASTSNFYLKPGRKSPQSLLSGISEGLWVTDMMGFGFDPITGNFSRGAQGFRIVNGELAEPVGEITISKNLHEILCGIEEIANDLIFDGSVVAPSFRVDSMTVSGR